MGIAQSALKALMSTGRKAGRIAGSAGAATKGGYDLSRALGSGRGRAAIDAMMSGGAQAGSKFAGLGPRGKAAVGGGGAGAALAAMAMMSGGDDEAMAEMAERSGLPIGGMGMEGLRQAQLGKFRQVLESALMSADDPDDVMRAVEEKVYNPLAARSNELPEDYPADDLYGFSEKLARVLYADAPDDQKMSALYSLAKEQ